MESTSSVTALPSYPSMFDRCDGKPEQGPGLKTDSDVFTQPVARRPIDSQCGGAGDGGNTIAPFEQQPDERAARFSYDGDIGSPRPL